MATNFSVSPGMNAGQLAGAYNQWAAYNGGDTPQNRQIANDILAGMGYNQDQINAGYQNYLSNHTVNGVGQTYSTPAAQIPGHLGGPLSGPQGYNSGAPSLGMYHMAQIGGFDGTYEDWQAWQAAQPALAQQALAANPNVVVGGHTPESQFQAVQQSLHGSPGGLPPGLSGTNNGSGSGYSGGASGGLFQGVDVNSYQQNPYLAQMGSVLTGQVTDNLNRNIMPSIRSNAVAAGGFGGSRQGVVEANALKDANRTISDALTGAYFQDFTNQMNRNLQQYGQNQNFYSNQRSQDLQQLGLGASLFNMGNQGWLSQGQGLYGLGGTQQQAPWQVINNANAGLGQWSGYGTTTSANQGGGSQGLLGGALAGGQLGSLWNNTGTSGVTAPPGGYNSGANYNFPSQGGLGLQWP